MYYNDKAECADADTPVMVAEDDIVAIEDANLTPIEMDEETNPFTEVQSAIEELQETEVKVNLPYIHSTINAAPYIDILRAA